MDDHEPALGYLAVLGVKAEVLHDAIAGKLIVIETSAYETRRGPIDAWFTRVRQVDNHTYFVVRMRGTGNTI